MITQQEPRFLCVHVPEFAAQARLRHRSDLHGKAIVILDGTPPLQTVCSLTSHAQTLGIARGTTRAELDSFPGIEALLQSEPEERSAAAALLTALWRFSPRVQVMPLRNAAYRLVLDGTGTERIFGPSEHLARVVRQEARKLGLRTQCAVSANFHAALCAAPYAGRELRVIARGSEREALAALPLRALDSLTDEQREIFELWGLQTLGEIAALPETQLIARLGLAGKRLWLLARGVHPHVMQPVEECFTLEESASFDTPVELLDSLLFVLRPMLDQLVMRATGRSLALFSVTVRLQLTNHAAEDTAAPVEAEDYARTTKPALPLADSRILLKLLQLELQAHPPGAPVIAVHLQAEPGDRARAQLGLFSPQLPEPSRLDITLARLRALVGEGRVGRPQLIDSHQSDSFTMERFAVPVQATGRSSAPKRSAASQPELPRQELRCGLALRRLRPPAPLRMRVVQARPLLFFWQDAKYDVTAAYGPWRQSGSWWSGAAWACEEWDVTAAASDGATLACRLAYDLLHREWRLEGVYD